MGVLRRWLLGFFRRIFLYRRTRLVRGLGEFARDVYFVYENFDYGSSTNGEYESLRKIASLERGGAIFDVGAHTGGWALTAAQIFTNAQIHCFEVSDPIIKQLKANTAGNRRITVNEFGLADHDGEVPLTFYPGKTNVTSIYRYPRRQEAVQAQGRVMTGDAYMREHAVHRVMFLKIDVEGAESLVLRGFDEALREGRIDAAQFEYGRYSLLTNFFLRDFYELFLRYGFVVGKIYPKYVAFRDYDFTHEDLLGPNYLAVRKERTAWINRLSQ